MSRNPCNCRLRAADSMVFSNVSSGTVIVPGKRRCPVGRSTSPSGTYANTGATSAVPSPAAILPARSFTRTELRDKIAAGKTVAIVPIGGTEQNGPHMAIGKHNLRVKLLAGKIATALGTALVAPV